MNEAHFSMDGTLGNTRYIQASLRWNWKDLTRHKWTYWKSLGIHKHILDELGYINTNWMDIAGWICVYLDVVYIQSPLG